MNEVNGLVISDIIQFFNLNNTEFKRAYTNQYTIDNPNSVYIKDESIPPGLEINFSKDTKNCHVYINSNVSIKNTKFTLNKSNAIVYIGEGASLSNLKVNIINENDYVLIGNKVTVNGTNNWSTGYYSGNDRNGIIIGDDSILCSDVLIKASDGYILKSLANEGQSNISLGPVVIEPYCYISQKSNILNGAYIGACSVVLTNSNVTAKHEAFSSISGNPANSKVDEDNVWLRNRSKESHETREFYINKYLKSKKYNKKNPEVDLDISLEEPLKSWDFLNTLITLEGNPIGNLDTLIKYSMDIGYLDHAYKAIENYEKSNGKIESYIDKKPKFWKAVESCNDILKTKICSSAKSEKNFFLKIHQLSINSKFLEVESLINEVSNKTLHKGISSESNMFLSHAIHTLIKSKALKENTAIKIVYHLHTAKNINQYRKKILIKSIINYFLKFENTSFFNFPDTFTNHLYRLMHILQGYSNNEKGAKALSTKLRNAIRDYNDFSLKKKETHNKKVAICISGMFKIDTTALDSLYKNIVEPLNADVFIHTWDSMQIWSGEARKSGFWLRQFKYPTSKIPPEIRDMDDFSILFPETGKILLSTISDSIDNHFDPQKYNIKKIEIENQDDAVSDLTVNESYSSRGHFNQLKMYYGIKKSFDLLREVENKENKKYDVIIRTRPDLFISKKLDSTWLEQLDFNSILVRFDQVGPSDQFFAALRQEYESFLGIWDAITCAGQLSPFENFPKYDSHVLLYTWLCYKKFDLIHIDQSFYDVSLTASSAKIPGLKEAISADLKKYIFPDEYKKEYTDLFNFLNQRSV
ncbi:acyltransferase [Candidatus Pantoea formicae]|uniref:acyltransferase n=1 Tax=Candidatus Pantoea formicae TaxID=2608355 RepID=UPI003EDA3B3E